MQGTLIQQIDKAKELHPEVPFRVEADTEDQVARGLEMARRAGKPEERPAETRSAPTAKAPLRPVNYHF